MTLTWADSGAVTSATVLHANARVMVLEGNRPAEELPAPGARVTVQGSGAAVRQGRLAAHGQGRRFLIALGERPVRYSSRRRVSLPATARDVQLDSGASQAVEIVDLNRSGARLRGISLPVGADLYLRFTPPDQERPEPVTVRAFVVHAGQDWLGVAFRLVVMPGGAGRS